MGRNWGPVLSAFLPGESPNAFHFQTQLSDGSIVAEEYYNQTSSGFGGFVKLPVPGPDGGPPFGPGYIGPTRVIRRCAAGVSMTASRGRAGCRSVLAASRSLTRVRPDR